MQKYFHSLCFNVNISVPIKHSHLIFSVIIVYIIRKGTVSKMCPMWPSSYLMQCIKLC